MVEKKILPTISASRLKDFKTCKRLYYHKYIVEKDKRSDSGRNISQLLGSSLHRAIELYYKDGKDPLITFQERMQVTYDQWNDDNLPVNGEEYLAKAYRDGKTILRGFDFTAWRPIELEKRFTLPFPNAENPFVLINGIIDLIDTRGIIVDFKSANKLPKKGELPHDVQFTIYHWAYSQLYQKDPIDVIWLHLRKQRTISVNTAHNYELKLEQLELDIKALLNTEAKIENYHRRSIDQMCIKQCPFFILCYGENPPKDAIDEDEEE